MVPRGSGRTGVPSRVEVASGLGEGNPGWLRPEFCDSSGRRVAEIGTLRRGFGGRGVVRAIQRGVYLR